MDWTVGKVLFAGAGAAGVALLVTKAIQSFRSSDSREPSLPAPPRPAVQLPRTPQPDWDPGPARRPAPGERTYVPSIEQWRGELQRQAPDIPIRYLMNYLDKESKGQPCSWGFHGKLDPSDNRYKFEAGIGQVYFSAKTREALDHVVKHGVSLAELRAPCDGQTQTRPLTDEEKQKNVQTFLGDVRQSIETSRKQLAKAGVSWPETTDDFWQLVKLQHGLPGIPGSFLKAAAEAGEAGSFEQFAAFVNALPRPRYLEIAKAAGWMPAMGNFSAKRIGEILNNARTVGAGVTAPGDIQLDVTDVRPA